MSTHAPDCASYDFDPEKQLGPGRPCDCGGAEAAAVVVGDAEPVQRLAFVARRGTSPEEESGGGERSKGAPCGQRTAALSEGATYWCIKPKGHEGTEHEAMREDGTVYFWRVLGGESEGAKQREQEGANVSDDNKRNRSSEARCEERVWDNGDMIDCGARLPCVKHPVEETKVGEVIDAVRRRLDRPYVLGEKRADRLADVVKLIESQRPNDVMTMQRDFCEHGEMGETCTICFPPRPQEATTEAATVRENGSIYFTIEGATHRLDDREAHRIAQMLLSATEGFE